MVHSFRLRPPLFIRYVEKTPAPSVESVFLLILISKGQVFIRHILTPLYAFFSFFTFWASI